MRIEVKQVISVLRSFKAPNEVIDYFARLEPSHAVALDCQTAIMQQVNRLADESSYIKRSDIQRRVLSLSSFRNHPQGGRNAFEEAIAELVIAGKLRVASLDEAKAVFNSTAVTYQVLP